MLVAHGIEVRRAQTTVIQGVSFEARAGEILAVVGPNGAGKTSLLEAVCGLRPRTQGSVAYDGGALESFHDHARTFSFMPDEILPAEELAVRDIWPGGASPFEIDRFMNVSLAHLSRGERKRVELAIALARRKPVAVLDEPFSAFDPIQLDGILEALRGRSSSSSSSSIIASIHQLDVAERIADRVLLLARGRALGFGSMAELREQTGAASLDGILRRLLDDAA